MSETEQKLREALQAISKRAEEILRLYDWPGDVIAEELKNMADAALAYRDAQPAQGQQEPGAIDWKKQHDVMANILGIERDTTPPAAHDVKFCHGRNCNASPSNADHSDECKAEHEASCTGGKGFDATPAAPDVDEKGIREAALRSLEYINGVKHGWNLGISNDEKRFAELLQTLPDVVREVKATRANQDQPAPDVRELVSLLKYANFFVEELTALGGKYYGLEGAVVADAYEVHRKISAALAKHGAQP